jgi:amino acid transporter
LNNSAQELAAENEAASEGAPSHALRRELGLWDLVPMQILLVVGIAWAGIAAKQGGTHVWFWLAAIATLFVPLAAVTGWCARVWPLEGGVYQWTKFAFGPFAGFMSAWNFGLFAVMLVVNLPGFGIGRWVAHFGTAVTVLVTVLLMGLLFYHPHASTAHPHVDPQRPFSFAVPAMTLLSVNLFTKIAINALSGLEQVAVFAGETRNPGRAIMRSAWIAAPIIAAIYILMTGAMLAYTPAAKVDLTGPVPQILAVAFGNGQVGASSIDLGLMLGRVTILILALALVAQYAVVIAETSRLPLVAGWDRMVPAWFTRLDPRWKTPTRSIAVIVVLAIAMGLAATYGTGAQEAFQIINSVANVGYGIYYLMMFAIPLVVGARFGTRASFWLKLAAGSGFTVTALSMGFNAVPIVDVASRWIFAAKVAGASLALNLAGVAIYWNGARAKAGRAN